MKRVACLAAAVALCFEFAAAQPASNLPLPPADRWLTHLNQELLPFWTSDAALGWPTGQFPSTRCDDGSLVNYADPCTEVANNSWLLSRTTSLVALSRQTYGYGVAFHMTGDPKYLDYMRAGVHYIRRYATDREHGGMGTQRDDNTRQWGPEYLYRNPQELGYGLLGMAFYYYLTHDPEVLPDLLRAKDYIFTHYYNASQDVMQWMLASLGDQRYDQKQLVAQLDQMNTYLVLLTPILPEPQRSEWKQSLVMLSRIMMDKFYSQKQNLFFLTANSPHDTDLAYAGTDFGHTAKAMWMIRFTGLITGRQDLVDFTEKNAPALFERAFITDSGAWGEGVNAGGAFDANKSWWIYAELDQLAGTLAMSNPALSKYLPSTYKYWFDYFVDRQHGEVWNGVYASSNRPIRDMPKSWPWKNAYHSFEHALVAYITTLRLQGDSVTLHYAFMTPPEPDQVRPYFFTGNLQQLARGGDYSNLTLWTATFSGVH